MHILLPVDVMWISKIKYDHKVLEKHTHQFYHMFFIRKGECIMHVAGKEYTADENEVYFCPPEIVHGMIAQGNIPLSTIEVKFTVLDKNFAEKLSELDYRVKCKPHNMYLKLEELVMEGLHKPVLYKEIVNTGFTRVLLELMRNEENPFSINIDRVKNSMNNEIKDKEGSSFVLGKVLDYMNRMYAEDITLQNLADVGAVSSAHLNKLFRSTFNISPMQYINNMRLDKAKELMMYSDFNISQISELVGFESIHYFSRYFKKKEGISPSEFRNGVKDNIYVYL
ncbi:MAG TPA: helix-turn-helix domain-containing protein [Clostridiales bacterium]|nr:helix-turn-helix domain-containing protein [Clostridiales bacterium]